MRSMLDKPLTPAPSFSQGWAIWLDNTKLAKIEKLSLYTWALSQNPKLNATKYWQGKSKLPQSKIQLVDWSLLFEALKGVNFNRRRWYVKLASGFCATGLREAWRGHQLDSHCPRCGIPNETIPHILRCQGKQSTMIWNSQLDTLGQWLNTSTDPAIKQSVIHGLQSWFNGSISDPPPGTVSLPLLQAQNEIGWDQFLLGRLSPAWEQAQAEWLEHTRQDKSSKQWAIQFVRRIWHIAWAIWDYRNTVHHQPSAQFDTPALTSLREQVQQTWQVLSPESKLSIPHPRPNDWSPHTLDLWLKGAKRSQRSQHARPPRFKFDPHLVQMRRCLAEFMTRASGDIH